jgi:hypothetical protein
MIWIYYIIENAELVLVYDCRELGRDRLHYHRADGSSGIAEAGLWRKRLIKKEKFKDGRE